MRVVLAHGILRFDELNVVLGRDVGPHYFDGIGDYLRQAGFTVDEPPVNFAGSLETRAKDLKTRLDKVPAGETIHIIAHSMGGLDARKVLFDHPEMAKRVRCLTTIGTPHLGTSSADLAFSLGGQRIIDKLEKVIDIAGFRDLTTDACARFNKAVQEREVANGVRYRAVAASESILRTTPLLGITAAQLAAEGASDGIVPVRSQHWDGAAKAVERLFFPIPADHLNEVGLWDPAEGLPLVFENSVKKFYLELARSA